MTVSMRPKYLFKVPVNARNISPDAFASQTIDKIKKFEVWEGNKKRTLGELFEITGESGETPKETSIQVTGDLRRVKRIGEAMTEGEITIEGNVGMHLGEKMKGGTITVTGDVGSWLGAMMKGGTITVKGNVGDYVGAAYRGSMKGMMGGAIIIYGNAGNEVGCFMRKGLIKIYGSAGQFVGIHMHNGTIFVQGDTEGRAGASIIDGKIVILGNAASVLPSFTFDDVKKKVKVDGEEILGPFYSFTGDLVEKGNGKLYVAKAKNQHLDFYEKYL
ncbi:MAG: formylmethanofuran dehydrogenase subunit C [Candidatus Bathyarchaeia archaeon]|nr:formylmethanofuran dehydrogenase subunit C [Candidatus Bathyarchaeota archaeon A05DMB-4]MDH7594739.1 formylmethanofuran dehydrogenase subunit C [Candidatus Bathyarchaeota archaeon]